MLFAVVDIETTGSYAAANGITEIAIVIHDGVKVLDFYESLVNPHVPIPYFIERLTGITNDMVSNAPSFEEIAGNVAALLTDKIFVAHNVNFDFSFVKYHLEHAGYTLNNKKLCTVRLARKVLPGLNGYSLSKLTQQLQINHGQIHRAGGDALATADLLKIIVAKDVNGEIQKMLKGGSKEQYLPPHLSVDDIKLLPSKPGVYYFYDDSGKVIYVGKAINLRKRVISHFSNNKVNKQKQDFLRETHKVSYKECATDLMAHILESAEIRRLWPKFNRSQRGYLPKYGLFLYEDSIGFKRMVLEKLKQATKPIYTFNNLNDGRECIKSLISKFELCNRLCNVSKDCECALHKTADEYNTSIEVAVQWLKDQLPTFALLDKGLDDNDYSCILILEGNFYGMGYIDDLKADTEHLSQLQQKLEPIPTNDFIRNLVLKHATAFPEKCVLYH